MKRYSEELALVNQFTREVPVNVELLAMSLGIDVVYSNLDNETSGIIKKEKDGRFKIIVNDNHPETRKRFTIAHELGHYFLHRHLIGNGISDNCAYRSSTAGMYANTDIGRHEETEANRFAATILMPYKAIKRLQEEERINDPASIAQKLGVSKQAYCIRMGIQCD